MPKISALTAATELTDDDLLVVVNDPTGTPGTRKITAANAATYFGDSSPAPLEYAISPEDSDLTTSHGITVRAPYDLTLTEVRASLTTESSSGAVSVDIEVDGESALSTELTVDASERTSTTAATPAVIGTDYVADDAEVAFVVTADGTGARGLKVKLYHTVGGTPPASDITFVAATQTTYATRTNTTITKPTGTIDGDQVIVAIVTGATGEAPDPTDPGGWTLLTNFPTSVTDGFEVEMRVYQKTASGEGADWTFTHTNCASQGAAVTYRNVNATPIDVNASVASGTGTTSTASTITTVTNNAMVLWVGHDWGSTPGGTATPSGGAVTYTERVDTGGPGLLYIADGLMATAGAVGAPAKANQNTGGSDNWVATLFALRPV